MLEEAGHKVTALDLAASGRNQEQLQDLPTIDDYHKPLFSFMEALSPGEKVILVGHSMGGYAVSSAMGRYPEKIDFGVFVSAHMLGPDLSIDKYAERFSPGPDFYLDSEQKTINVSGGTQTVILFGNEFLEKKIYQNSPHEDLILATLLARPTKFFNDDESKKQLLVSKERYGSLGRAYIIGGSDESLPIDCAKVDGKTESTPFGHGNERADHMVMISKPQELCANLLEIIMKFDKTCSNL